MYLSCMYFPPILLQTNTCTYIYIYVYTYLYIYLICILCIKCTFRRGYDDYDHILDEKITCQIFSAINFWIAKSIVNNVLHMHINKHVLTLREVSFNIHYLISLSSTWIIGSFRVVDDQSSTTTFAQCLTHSNSTDHLLLLKKSIPFIQLKNHRVFSSYNFNVIFSLEHESTRSIYVCISVLYNSISIVFKVTKERSTAAAVEMVVEVAVTITNIADGSKN